MWGSGQYIGHSKSSGVVRVRADSLGDAVQLARQWVGDPVLLSVIRPSIDETAQWPPVLAYFSPAVLDKARKLVDSRPDAVDVDVDGRVVRVASLRSKDQSYRVTMPDDTALILCSCEHGRNAQGESRCYHAAAAVMTMLDQNRARLERLAGETDER